MCIEAAVIPAAGLGTRLLPYTKGIPKEMLPIIVKENNRILVKPALQYIFESLYDSGIRRYYFIVGRGKRVIEDYFTPDYQYIEFLEEMGKKELASTLKGFYEHVENSEIIMINQPLSRGFSDVTLRTRSLMTNNLFIVRTGDNIMYPNHTGYHTGYIKALVNQYRKFRSK